MQLKPTLVARSLVLTLAACSANDPAVVDTESQATRGAPPFAIYARNSVVVRAGARVGGGAIGASRSARIEGATVEEVHAPSVTLTYGTAAGDVFTDRPSFERGARYTSYSPFRGSYLPTGVPSAVVGAGERDLSVAAGTLAYLTRSARDVYVGSGATLVIGGGFFELRSLELARDAIVTVTDRSRLTIAGRVIAGPGARIEPSRGGDVINLELDVLGRGGLLVPAVDIGDRAQIRAFVFAREGAIRLGNDVTAYGKYWGNDVDIGPAADVFDYDFFHVDSKCLLPYCYIYAIDGGTIDIECGMFEYVPSISSWLSGHPTVANAIEWQFQTTTTPYTPVDADMITYPSWSAAEKDELYAEFEDYWHAYCSGHPLQGDDGLTDPPVNAAENIANDTNSAQTKLSEADMRKLYLADTAHALVLELGDHVPWSITNDDDESLEVLLASRGLGRRGIGTLYSVGQSGPLANYDDRRNNQGHSTPAPPAWTHQFLVGEGLLGATRYETIVNLLNWSRDHLIHFYGYYQFARAEEIWQYRGHVPVRRVVSGTADSGSGGQFEHWTAGCHGTAGFFRSVLRAANIPVQIPIACDHAQIYFRSEGLYLDHGDNPYTFYTNALFPPEAALIDQATYESWFGTNLHNETTGCDNVGRRPQELQDAAQP